MMPDLKLPRLYPILDAGLVQDENDLLAYAALLQDFGLTFLQYRNKHAGAGVVLRQAQALQAQGSSQTRWIMNDRADLCVAAGYAGLHLGQDDLSVAGARKVVSGARWIGISTHDRQQLEQALQTDADYIAIGPVYGTQSKLDPDPVVGLEGVRMARAMTKRPLVAIGGITVQNAAAVIDAGADSVAVISALVERPSGGGHWVAASGKRIEAFLRVLGYN